MSGLVKLQASDGHELDAYVAEPDGKPWGALVVVQEIFGVNLHMRSVADHFAQEGFDAVVPALFDRVEPNVELTDDGTQKGMALAQKIDINDALKDMDAALQYAAKKTGKPAGVVGYCYGGTLAWLSATRLSPAAAVGYYGGQIGRFALESPRAPVLLHFGKQDGHIPQADVEKVHAAHPEVEICWYDAGHAFNNDTRASYNAEAAKEAMARTVAFFNRHL
ncbi:MAG: carboxymethylenebutenolidase [Acidobacteriaceae bacterium]|jgi:carboxymethylenebutenolidase|nr:carboxymethylenebutenolidase [Acidobacteriaceae bacterium]MDX6464294.1 carboxymethylenebutenolidase [Acidobacteriaceae bacterium]MEA2538802.1 carboxymethylenebutenolidase [Acidobacteriaceae bacterium]